MGPFCAAPLSGAPGHLAYTFGLRHAVDADHIAAIDNVTRKLMQYGQRPVAVVFFFSLGHSTIVIIASFAIALATGAVRKPLRFVQSLRWCDRYIGPASFLFLVAAANLFILRSVFALFARFVTAARTPKRISISFWSSEDYWADSSALYSGW
jgi:high-affinity nickel-transport protein